MKNKILTLTLLLICTFGYVVAQNNNWETSHYETISFPDASNPPNYLIANIPIPSTITSKDVGIGLMPSEIPESKLEIRYCNGSNNISGLIITQKFCGTPAGPFNYSTIPISFDGKTQPEAISKVYPSFELLGYGASGTTLQGQSPLIWARTENDNTTYPNGTTSGSNTTQFMVTPYGRSGINIENPRATFDIKSLGSYNHPALIVGRQRFGSTNRTQHVHFIPLLDNKAYNNISQMNDQGMFFTDGGGNDGTNLSGAFVIAP